MDMLSPALSRAVAACDHLDGRANRAAINRAFRREDESYLWPISGRFNATERAIRRVRDFSREAEIDLTGLEYALAVDAALSEIVNSEV